MSQMPVYITTGDGTNTQCQECSSLNDALKIAKRQGGYIWREEDGMVLVYSNIADDLWDWEPAELFMATFLRRSR